jgi:hypothetical protein
MIFTTYALPTTLLGEHASITLDLHESIFVQDDINRGEQLLRWYPIRKLRSRLEVLFVFLYLVFF